MLQVRPFKKKKKSERQILPPVPQHPLSRNWRDRRLCKQEVTQERAHLPPEPQPRPALKTEDAPAEGQPAGR